MKGTLGPLGAAGGILLLIVVGAIAATAAQHHHSNRPTASASTPVPVLTADPTPTPTSEPTLASSPPPSGIRLMWRAVAADSPVIEAVDTSGAVRGRLVLQSSDATFQAKPDHDGQRLLMGSDGAYHVLSAQGVNLGTLPAASFGDLQPTWSDDDTHFCGMVTDSAGQSARLVLAGLGLGPRVVSSFSWPMGDGGAQVDACSVRNDVAVVHVSLGDDAAGHVVEYRVVRLSTGHTIRDVRPPAPNFSGPDPRPAPGALSYVRASADGRRMALTSWADMNVSDPRTAILDTVSGREIGHINGYDITFTAGDTAVDLGSMRSDWQTGRVTVMPRRCCGPTGAARLGDEDLVVQISGGPPPTPSKSPGQAEGPYPPSIYLLLHPDGSLVRLAWGGARLL